MICILIVLTGAALSSAAYNAASGKISYSFTKQNPGYAEGTITLSAPAGTYWLYWADDTKALDGYYSLAKLTLSSQGAKTHKMYERSSIPADAKKLIAIQSSSEPASKRVTDAFAVYNIPDSKKLGHSSSDRKYRFASYSDVHIDGVKLTYKYDEIHLRKAFDTAAARDTDFIVMSGDYVNNNIDYSGISTKEWKTYQRILAESDYCNPVYEAIGNHELWQDPVSGTKDFIKGTGLDGSKSTAPNAYFEKTLGGDHFIFMALETSFYPDRTEEFSNAQLSWLEDLLKKYSGDGKNIYIIEHSLFYKYGAGDRMTGGEPYYDIPLKDDQQSTRKLKALLEKYKDVIFMSGHTHIAFAEQYNFSDNNGGSAQMIHNSSIGGVRHIIGGELDRDYKEDDAEGYIVDVFDDAIIFNGANLYYNKYDPNCCYIVNPSASFFEKPSEPASSVQPTTNTEATDTIPETETSSETVTESATESTETHTESQTETQTESASAAEPKLLGDVNRDTIISVKDATMVQKHSAKIITLNEEEKLLADVNLDGSVNVKDATMIQKLVAKLIKSFDEENNRLKTGADIRTEVKSNLDKYYRYSSYDCYQALKKAYKSNAETAALTTLNADLLAVVDPSNVDFTGKWTVYFENTNNWSKVYVYNWGRNGAGKPVEWPGEKLTSIGKNKYGKSLYKYTVPDTKYNWVLFSNGSDSEKTADIQLDDNNMAYYISGTSVPYDVMSYVFKDSYIVSQ